MKKPSETSFQRVCLDFVRLWLWTLSGKRDSNSRPQPWQGCALPTELFPQLHGFVRRRTSPFRECKYKSLFGFKQTFPAKNFAFVSIFRYRAPRRRIGQSHKPTRCRRNQAVPQQASRIRKSRSPAAVVHPTVRRNPGNVAISQSDNFTARC